MSGHLCLKWNNHSTAFIKSISNIQIKERYCDATIACQGRYFPVHRVVLSTCSDYFDEIFERIDCPHPYIIFKDIEPREMELLLNYMYQGEVNVVQENLPTLIKAAEALKVKGLAVPDDLPASKDSSSKKRSSDTQLPKRRSEEKRRRRDSSDQNSHPNSSSTTSERNSSKSDVNLETVENKVIKEEPLESAEYENPPMQSNYGEAGFSGGSDSAAEPSQIDPGEKSDGGGGIFVGFPGTEETENFIKSEDPGPTEPYNEEQSSSWSDFAGGDIMQDLPETSTQDDVSVSINFF
ncbi:Sex determination protein fruitless [Armadillidium nasatum]|uniref:Sex determination protein fruitless n=1 Tax=Armadillidium nasatum TaxID=96803 RepID=A0A5N5T5E6_9CRUS|nr:Sex determination protein fruitless [Armadillidium nasatum]